jgi:hypothetical protein
MFRVFSAVLFAAGMLAVPAARAQVQYSRGQDVQPVFEGWKRNPDQTYTLYFGYFNRNFEEIVDIPVGPENKFDDNVDHSQPTHFLTRRQMFVFPVILPKNWDANRKLTWTVSAHGHPNYAKGWLQPEWEVDDGVISENLGSGESVGDNKPPTIKGDIEPIITKSNTVSLQVVATDDGVPRPPVPAKPESNSGGSQDDPAAAAPAKRPVGVGVKWIQYRGPAPVSITPAEEKPVYGQPVTAKTTVKFTAPGEYWIRAVANDGALQATHDFKVIVQMPIGK